MTSLYHAGLQLFFLHAEPLQLPVNTGHIFIDKFRLLGNSGNLQVNTLALLHAALFLPPDLLQFLLSLQGIRLVLLFLLLRSPKLQADSHPALTDILKLLLQLAKLHIQPFVTGSQLRKLFPGLICIQRNRILLQILLLETGIQLFRRLPEGTAAILNLLNAKSGGVHLLLQTLYIFLKLFKLPAASQKIAGIAEGASCHGASRT